MPSPPTISALTDHLGYWLRAVSNQVSHAFSLKLSTRDVTVAEWVILRQMFDQAEIAPSDLATAVGLTRGAVSKLIDRLEAKALVARSTQAQDRRYQSVALTAEGRALVPDLSALADANDAAFFDQLRPLERVALKNLLRELAGQTGAKTPLK